MTWIPSVFYCWNFLHCLPCFDHWSMLLRALQNHTEDIWEKDCPYTQSLLLLLLHQARQFFSFFWWTEMGFCVGASCGTKRMKTTGTQVDLFDEAQCTTWNYSQTFQQHEERATGLQLTAVFFWWKAFWWNTFESKIVLKCHVHWIYDHRMMQSINETLPLWVQRHCVQTQWISGNFGREWSRSHAFASFLRKTPKSPPSRCKRIVVQVSYYSCIYARLYTVYDIIYVYEKNTWFHAVVFLWCSLLKKMLSKYKIFLEKQLPPP